MWPGRMSQRVGDQLATPVNALSLPEKSIPRKAAKGGQETGTPRVAENQRRNKELAALGTEKGTGDKEA